MRGDAHLLMEAGDLGAHLHTQLGIQVGERLVHQEDARLPHDGAPQRDALLLAAGERGGPALELAGNAEQRGGMRDAARDLGAGKAADLQAERQVLVDAHMGEERVALEDHRHIPPLRGHVVNALAIHQDVAGGGSLQPRDHA